MLGVYFVPLLLACLALECWSLVHLGHRQGLLGNLKKVSEDGAILYGCTHLFAILATLFLASAAAIWLGKSFHCEVNYSRCLVAIGYSMGPLCLGRALDAVPALNTWIAWAIGAFLAVSQLYHGIPRLLRPEPTKALGLFFLSGMVLMFLSAVGHFLAILVLRDPIFYP